MTIAYILGGVAALGGLVWLFLTKLGAANRNAEQWRLTANIVQASNYKLRIDIDRLHKELNDKASKDNAADVASGNAAGIADRLRDTVSRR